MASGSVESTALKCGKIAYLQCPDCIETNRIGDWRVGDWPDGWTSVTADGERSAQFEHTVLVTDTGVEVLTGRLPSSPNTIDVNRDCIAYMLSHVKLLHLRTIDQIRNINDVISCILQCHRWLQEHFSSVNDFDVLGANGKMKEQDPLENSVVDVSVELTKALGMDSEAKWADEDEGFFGCSICSGVSRDPVLTPCGHVFCWACYFQVPYLNKFSKECPTCKAGVFDGSLIPIYGSGSCGASTSTSQPGLQIPPRPNPCYRIKLNREDCPRVPIAVSEMKMSVNSDIVFLEGRNGCVHQMSVDQISTRLSEIEVRFLRLSSVFDCVKWLLEDFEEAMLLSLPMKVPRDVNPSDGNGAEVVSMLREFQAAHLRSTVQIQEMDDYIVVILNYMWFLQEHMSFGYELDIVKANGEKHDKVILGNIVEKTKALGIDSEAKKAHAENEGVYFECSICLGVACDPVLTPCGHLYCWGCYFQIAHVNDFSKECPTCKAHVFDGNLIPIYGIGGRASTSASESRLQIPLRPNCYRNKSAEKDVFLEGKYGPVYKISVDQISTCLDEFEDRFSILSSALKCAKWVVHELEEASVLSIPTNAPDKISVGMASTVESTTLFCAKCSKIAHLRCPICVELKLACEGAAFCSQECFKASYDSHKAVHLKKLASPAENPDEQSFVVYCSENGVGRTPKSPDFDWTGTLRPYPVSVGRSVPADIDKPDWADDGIPLIDPDSPLYEVAEIKTPDQITKMRETCQVAREVLDAAAHYIQPGITTDEIDAVVHQAIICAGGYPSHLNLFAYPKSCCTSVNEVICKGVPDARKLEDGDIVNVDVAVYYNGVHGAVSETFLVGNVDEVSQRLVQCAYDCMEKAIAMVKPGVSFREIWETVNRHASVSGFSVVKDYCSHGIDEVFACAPNIFHFSKNKTIGVMVAGQTLSIGPMINSGDWPVVYWPDGWTSVSADGKRSAQFEHTILVTDTGVDVLTGRLPSSPNVFPWLDP